MAQTNKPLTGTRVLSLALNLPGPAALMRLRKLGARCTKLEPPTGDPMQSYRPEAYVALHTGVRVVQADLKSETGRKVLQRELARTDVLLTSFRPSALKRLGLDWRSLHRQFPQLCQVAIVGAPGAAAEIPGHDLTYMAEQGLIQGLNLPPTLYADMGGALMASEAVLQVLLQRGLAGPATALGSGRTSHSGGRRPCGLPCLRLQGRARGGGRTGAAFRAGAVQCSGVEARRHVSTCHAQGAGKLVCAADAAHTGCAGASVGSAAAHPGKELSNQRGLRGVPALAEPVTRGGRPVCWVSIRPLDGVFAAGWAPEGVEFLRRALW